MDVKSGPTTLDAIMVAIFQSAIKSHRKSAVPLIITIFVVILFFIASAVGFASNIVQLVESKYAIFIFVLVLALVVLATMVVLIVRFWDANFAIIDENKKLKEENALLQAGVKTLEAYSENLHRLSLMASRDQTKDMLYRFLDYLETFVADINKARQFKENDILIGKLKIDQFHLDEQDNWSVALPIGKKDGATQRLEYYLHQGNLEKPESFPAELGIAVISKVEDCCSLATVYPAPIQQNYWNLISTEFRRRSGDYKPEMFARPRIREPLQDCSVESLESIERVLRTILSENKGVLSRLNAIDTSEEVGVRMEAEND